MQLEKLPFDLTICQPETTSVIASLTGFFTLSVTDEEVSLVCETKHVPAGTQIRENGWKAFRITGVRDFSLIGILSGITAVLAEAKIGVFVISTYNTDYILVKKDRFPDAAAVLTAHGYEIL